jgi:hypothetical protein
MLQSNYPELQQWLFVNKSFAIAGQLFETYLHKQTSVLPKWLAINHSFSFSGNILEQRILREYLQNVNNVLKEWMRPFVSDRGYIGMAHP